VKCQDVSGVSASKEEKITLLVYLDIHILQSMLSFHNVRTEVTKHFLIL